MNAFVCRIGLACLSLTLLGTANAPGATYRTTNFVTEAPTTKMARAIGTHAEKYRKELAVQWFGRKLPDWTSRCPVVVDPGTMQAQGSTSFSLIGGEFSRWKIVVRGPYDDILHSVLPHEVSHAVFATHFGRPLPRWADEGAAMLAEDESEQRRHRLMIRDRLEDAASGYLRKILRMHDYPAGSRNMVDLYVTGYSLTAFLVQKEDRENYVRFLVQAARTGWDRAVRDVYGYESIEALETAWRQWVRGPDETPSESSDGIWVDRGPATGQSGRALALKEGGSDRAPGS